MPRRASASNPPAKRRNARKESQRPAVSTLLRSWPAVCQRATEDVAPVIAKYLPLDRPAEPHPLASILMEALATSDFGPTEYLSNLSIELLITTNRCPTSGILLDGIEEQIRSIRTSTPKYFNLRGDALIEQSWEDLQEPAFYGYQVSFVGRTALHNERTYTNCKGYFTAEEMIHNVLDFEVLDRPSSEFIGEIDCHYRYFEGLRQCSAKAYRILWGS